MNRQAASLRLGCTRAACQGNIRLWYDNILLGERSYSLANGRTGSFATHLCTEAMRLLAKAEHHTLEVGVVVTVRGGATTMVLLGVAG